MSGARPRILRIAFAAVLLAPTDGARAALIGDYFPDGVPGYATERGVTVLTRLRPELDPFGVRIDDTVDLHPALELTTGFDDNPNGAAAPRGSAVATVHPSLLADTETDRVRAAAYLALTDTRYPELAGQGRTDWTASLGARVEVGPGKLTLAAAHLHLHQDRTQIDALAADRPIAFDLDDVRLAYAVESGPWTFTPDIDVTAWRFDATTIQGLPAPQSYRDRTLIQAGLTARYDLGPERAAIVALRGDTTAYGHGQFGQPSRNGHGATLLAGLDWDDDGVWHWRLLIGAAVRAYQARQYATHAAPLIEADVIWNSSGMTTLTGEVARSIEDASQEGVAGFDYTRVRVSLDHEYLRNLLLHAQAGVQIAQFQQGGGTQAIETLGVGATWIVNRYARVVLDLEHSSQQGGRNTVLPAASDIGVSPVTGNYAREIALLTLRLAL